MFIEAVVIKYKKWKRNKYPSTDQWIDEMWYIYRTDMDKWVSYKRKWSTDSSYSMNEIQKHSAKWEKKCQTQKATYFMVNMKREEYVNECKQNLGK